MGSEWKEYTLGQITKWFSGGTPPKKDQEYWNGDIPWISASSMNGNRYNDSKLKLTEKGLKRGSRIAPKDSLLLLVRGSILHQKIQVGITEKDVAFNQDVKSLLPNEDIVDPWFLLFWFMSKEPELLGMVENTGIGAGKLDTKLMQNLSIKIPPYHERKAIVGLFKALDDKIELNRQMNQTLEQMAQALFKSWFVDFDPVIDNARTVGNPIPDALQKRAEQRKALGDNSLPLPENIQNLFPAEFEFSEELDRWVPLGWKVKALNEFINVKHGFAFKGKYFSTEPTSDILLSPGNFKIGGGFKGDKFKYYNAEYPEAYILKEGDLIITMTDLSKAGDTLGYPAIVPDGGDKRYLHNQRLGKVEFKTDLFNVSYLYYCLCTENYRNEILGNTSGSTVKHTSPTKILAHKIALSKSGIENEFSKYVTSLNEKVAKNNHEIESLTKLRDTLLPKLLSGEVRVPEEMVKNQTKIYE